MITFTGMLTFIALMIAKAYGLAYLITLTAPDGPDKVSLRSQADGLTGTTPDK